jgi:hypothetical protein
MNNRHMYSLMVHFMVSMMHQHRLPVRGYETLGMFYEQYPDTIESIIRSAHEHFGYGICSAQLGSAIALYLQTPLAVVDPLKSED